MKKKKLRFMMMNRSVRYIVFTIAITSLIIMACSKGGSGNGSDPGGTGPDIHAFDPGDTTKPVLTVNTPIDNQVFKSGDTIRIDGRITDNGLYRGDIKINNDANNLPIANQHYEIHGLQQYDFHYEYKVYTTVASIYTVTVMYEDHGYNQGLRNIKVAVNP